MVAKGGMLVVNKDAFTERNVQKAGYTADPLDDGTLDGYQVYKVPMTSITVRATEGIGIGKKESERAKNIFALGLVSWMFGRPTETTLNWLEKKFGSRQEIFDANVAAFKAGFNFGETTELFAESYKVKAAPQEPGTYRNIDGATALAWGLIAASKRSGLPLFYASYPITPASELLHELSRHKNFGVVTFQAEDEIAAANIALGAAFSGQLGRDRDERARHRPEGRDDRARGDHGAADDHRRRAARGPLDRHADEDRAGGPAAGDVRTPRGIAAADRVGVHPVGVLHRRARGGPDRRALPDAGDPALRHVHRELLGAVADPRRREPSDDRSGVRVAERQDFLPYARDERLARPWAIPGTPGLVHRIGGLERQDGTGNISYDAANHELMTQAPPGEGRRHRRRHPGARGRGPERRGRPARARLGLLPRHDHGGRRAGEGRRPERGDGASPAPEPVPREYRRRRARVRKVLIPEMNMGQLAALIRAKYLVDAQSYSKVQGLPIFAEELEHEIARVLDE